MPRPKATCGGMRKSSSGSSKKSISYSNVDASAGPALLKRLDLNETRRVLALSLYLFRLNSSGCGQLQRHRSSSWGRICVLWATTF